MPCYPVALWANTSVMYVPSAFVVPCWTRLTFLGLGQVIETFRAFLSPLYPVPTTAPLIPEINYDAILPSSRRPIARSLDSCRSAMRQISKDLSAWGQLCRERGCGRKRGNEADAKINETEGRREKSEPVDLGMEAHNAGGERDGLADEMERIVKVAAITPTKQEMGSTVGREVSFSPLI